MRRERLRRRQLPSLVLLARLGAAFALVILAAFTYTSGLRGATLTAVLKDALLWITVISVIVVIPLSISGGLGSAFNDVKPNYLTVPSPLLTGYATLVLGSALALYLYPHAINGVLSLGKS